MLCSMKLTWNHEPIEAEEHTVNHFEQVFNASADRHLKSQRASVFKTGIKIKLKNPAVAH